MHNAISETLDNTATRIQMHFPTSNGHSIINTYTLHYNAIMFTSNIHIANIISNISLHLNIGQG